jgi:hypothetical protein
LPALSALRRSRSKRACRHATATGRCCLSRPARMPCRPPGPARTRMAKAGLKLSGEYAWMKRSFDGVHVGSWRRSRKMHPRTTSGSSSGAMKGLGWRNGASPHGLGGNPCGDQHTKQGGKKPGPRRDHVNGLGMTWRDGRLGPRSVCGIPAAAIKGRHVRSPNGGWHGLLGCGSGVGLHRQAEGMKSDGLGAHRYRSRWGAVLYAAT